VHKIQHRRVVNLVPAAANERTLHDGLSDSRAYADIGDFKFRRGIGRLTECHAGKHSESNTDTHLGN
jgi:hypothetical protein